jgi:hypothetical protein
VLFSKKPKKYPEFFSDGPKKGDFWVFRKKSSEKVQNFNPESKNGQKKWSEYLVMSQKISNFATSKPVD